MLAEKVVLITGASTGIGAASARLFAREGASVVVSARSEDKLVDLAAEIRAAGGQASHVVADVSRDEDCAAVVAAAVEWFGRLDAAFNNAGIGPEGVPLVDGSPETWDTTLAINLTSVAQCMRHEIRAMLAEAAAWLISDRASFVTGAELAVDGGYTAIAPYVG